MTPTCSCHVGVMIYSCRCQKRDVQMKKTLLLILLFISHYSSAEELIKHPRLLSFEKEIPSFILSNNSKLSLSADHFRDGENSLLWEFTPKSELIIHKNIEYEKTPLGSSHISTFSTWIYNETPLQQSLVFQFYKDDQECCSFQYNLNFTGWRAAYVAYDRDMKGTPQSGMNKIVITAPQKSGRVFFDMLLTASKVDKRHHTPDIQQPFVNKGVTNHWQVMLEKSKIKADTTFLSPISNKDKHFINVMEGRLKEIITKPTKITDSKIEQLKEKLAKYAIQRKNNQITGLPLFYVYYSEAFEKLIPNWSRKLFTNKGQEFKEYFDLMYQIASSYEYANTEDQKKNLEEMFLDMFDYAEDQGVSYGSGLGNASHYGYSFRGYFSSCFLMKDVLLRHNRLDKAYHALQWYAQTNEVFSEPTINGQDMDAFNTLALAKICSILLMDNSDEKLQYIRAYGRWIDTGCKPAPGLRGSFKVDGGAFHHVNHYPAYAVGGLGGAVDMIYIYHQTPYAISEEGHSTIKRVLLNMRFYCNQNHFPLALSGRHPDGKGTLEAIQYGRLAMSGTPDGKQNIDTKMASAYLRLIKGDKNQNNYDNKKLKKYFTSMNISEEAHPEGNLTMGYASITAHRRANWLAIAKGFSRYFWAAEHYAHENLFGRYLSYGSLQILTAKDSSIVSPKTSGWIEEGFDWARVPGATAIKLPIEKMRAAKNKSELLLSDESFVGGITQKDSNGAYAIKLHEHGRYEGSHRARKSYHFFDNRIICLGSNIENENSEYHTETTIFQLAILNKGDFSYWEKHTRFKSRWIDHLGTAYYISPQTTEKLVFEKSYPQKSKLNTGKLSQGDWINLTIDHGISPNGETYEYVIIPQATQKELDTIEDSYEVLQKDKNAHIVKDLKSKTTSFVFFETPKSIPSKILLSVDTTGLVMLKENKKSISLTVSNPDLAFYKGESQILKDKNGRQQMINPYAVPWKDNESQEMPITIRLKGKWYPSQISDSIIITHYKDETILVFKCKHAFSYDVTLSKQK